jgi:hypothetical protein
MTDEEVLDKYNRMVEQFGDNLPNPEQEPIRFKYYVKLFDYYHNKTDTN